MARTTTITPPSPSPLTSLLTSHSAKHSSQSLPLEILHNLQHQHSWTDLHLHTIINGKLLSTNTPLPTTAATTPSTSSASTPTHLISGLPPKHTYIHPDLQSHLLRHQPHPIPESSIAIQREYVLPLSLSEKRSIAQFAYVFDALPIREVMRLRTDAEHVVSGEGGSDGLGVEWRDAKRVLLGMMSANGTGGDGTVVYYVMQEGEVKPRQNG